MIPKKIHYCWFGPNSRSDLHDRCLGSWLKHMPDFEIKKWDESNSPMDNPYIQKAIERQYWSKVSNFVRLHALHTEGGVYLDTDIEVFRSFLPLLTNRCFLGFQQKRRGTDWINNAVMGAIAGHRFVEECMTFTQDTLIETGRFWRSPEVVTSLLRNEGLQAYGPQIVEDVRLYPIEYFYPYAWWEGVGYDRIKDLTYCVHHWELSWVKREAGKSYWRWRLGKHLRSVFASQ